MGLLDSLTGGKNKKANKALQQALEAFQAIKSPTVQDLTLPELQKYVEAGVLTPDQAKAFLVEKNAYDSISLDPTAREAELKALDYMQRVGESGGMTDTMKAQLAEAMGQVATQSRGYNNSVLDQMAQRGIPQSLMGYAAMMENNASQQGLANRAALDSAAQAEMNALKAMESSANIGSQVRGEDYKQAADRAAAANAISQWNAQNQTGVGLSNTAANNAAQAANLQNKQQISNANVGNANERTKYNSNLAQQVFQNDMAKAQGMAGVYGQQAQNYTGQGQQNAGLWSGIINAVSPAIGSAFKGAGTPTGQNYGFDPKTMSNPPAGFTPYAHGGEAEVPGDSPLNDKIPAMLSEKEIVLPRSVTMSENAPEQAKQFVRHILNNKKEIKPVDPADIHVVLEALTKRREA